MSLLRSIYKKKIFVAISFLILAFGVFLAPKAYSYYEAQKLEREADILIAQEKYQSALEKYEKSKEKWDDVAINEKITKINKLIKIKNIEETDKQDIKGIQTATKSKSEVVVSSLKTDVLPTLTPYPTSTPIPTTTPLIFPTSVPTHTADDTQKLMAMKGLFEQIGDQNKIIIVADVAINNLTPQLEDCRTSKQYLYQEGLLSPDQIESLIQDCRTDILSRMQSYSNSRSSAYNQISSIDRQIQNIIATCQTDQCYEVYQGVISELEAQGYVAR